MPIEKMKHLLPHLLTSRSFIPPFRRSFSAIHPNLIEEVSLPMNCGIVRVAESRVYVVERMGKYKKVLSAGMHFLIPRMDKISFVHCISEDLIKISNQAAITKDHARISFDSVCGVKIIDPYLTAYATQKPVEVLIDLLYLEVRKNLVEFPFDEILRKMTSLDKSIMNKINETASMWSYKCVRYEIINITFSSELEVDTEMRDRAKKRAAVKDFDYEGEIKRAIEKTQAAAKIICLISEAVKECSCVPTEALKIADLYMVGDQRKTIKKGMSSICITMIHLIIFLPSAIMNIFEQYKP